MFERFLHEYQGDEKLKKWNHETQSIRLFNHMLEDNGINIRDYGLDDKDGEFIKEMILGNDGNAVKQGRTREEKKEFLYDIVNNAVSGLDVDKLDYLIRDKKGTLDPGAKGEDIVRILKTAVVMENNDVCDQDLKEGFSQSRKRQHICFPTKSADDILASVFRCRYKMHRKVYTHKAVVAHEFMICDILKLIQDIPLIASKTGGLLTIKEAVSDLDAYTRLNDSVIDLIQNIDIKVLELEGQQKLEKAKALLERMNRRQTYKFVGEVVYEGCKQTLYLSSDDDKQAVFSKAREGLLDAAAQMETGTLELEDEDLILEVRSCHYGAKESNPLDNIRFFKKAATDCGGEELTTLCAQAYGTSVDLPRQFMNRSLRIFCRHDGEKLGLAKEAFKSVFETEDEEIGLSQE
jgi:HD superfamily phosphohydrolase